MHEFFKYNYILPDSRVRVQSEAIEEEGGDEEGK